MSCARSVAATDFIARCHHHTVGGVAAEVRERTHWCCVVTEDDLGVVHGPGLVELRPPRGRPHDLKSVGAHHRYRNTLWTTGHWHKQKKKMNRIHLTQSKSLSSQLLLTGGMVEKRSLGTPASLVEGEHRHQIHVATLAGEGAVVAGGVADPLTAITSLDEGLVAVGVRDRFPRQRAVSFWRPQKSQWLWWAGVWTHRTAGRSVRPVYIFCSFLTISISRMHQCINEFDSSRVSSSYR